MATRHLVPLVLALATAACAPAPLVSTPVNALAAAAIAPTGATRIQTLATSDVRYFTLSPDGSKVAYMPNAPIGQLHIAAIGGADAQVADLEQDVGGLQWTDAGDAVLYETAQQEVIPGQYSDWDIPATKLLSNRIERSSVAGGAPETLVEAKQIAWFHANGTQVYYTTRGDDGQPDASHVYDMATKATKDLPLSTSTLFQVAPDGKTIATFAFGSKLDLYDVATTETRSLDATDVLNVGWIAPGKLVLIYAKGRLKTIDPQGKTLADVTLDVDPDGVGLALGKVGPGGQVSPDGKWSLGFGKGKDPGAPVISFESGHVAYTTSFAWRTWLDATTLVGVFGDGVYTMPLSQALAGQNPNPPLN